MTIHALYGDPPPRLADIPADARQCSPLKPGAMALDACPDASLAGLTMLAAPGTLERRHDLAQMLRALAPGAPFTVLAPKDSGGSRLGGDFARLGCPIEENAKAHHRICRGTRPDTPDMDSIGRDIADGAPRKRADLGLWSQPGIFSWDRVDPGSAALAAVLPRLAGRGADLGCGIGLLAHKVLAEAAVTRLDLLDIDRRAVEAARRNVDDPRVAFHWMDVRAGTGLKDLDFIVMNPPFHAAGQEDQTLGQVFIARAAEALRAGGKLWLVANRHLPYERVLDPLFRRVTAQGEAREFKVFEALK